jgi:hypothetical protein
MLKYLNIRIDLDQLKNFYMNLSSEIIGLLVANLFIYGAESVDSTSKPSLVNLA